MNVKPGWTTTEFWVSLIGVIGGAIAAVHPGFDTTKWVAPLAAAAAAVSALGYAVSRAWVKAAAHKASGPPN